MRTVVASTFAPTYTVPAAPTYSSTRKVKAKLREASTAPLVYSRHVRMPALYL